MGASLFPQNFHMPSNIVYPCNLSFEADPKLRNTDIQSAEGKIYRRLAELNQERLIAKQPIYRQSVIWMTDAPLFSKSPATEQDWIETPPNSPFRDANMENLYQ